VSDYRIESTAEADEHARAMDTWWREHRTSSPDLFLNELIRVFALLERLATRTRGSLSPSWSTSGYSAVADAFDPDLRLLQH